MASWRTLHNGGPPPRPPQGQWGYTTATPATILALGAQRVTGAHHVEEERTRAEEVRAFIDVHGALHVDDAIHMTIDPAADTTYLADSRGVFAALDALLLRAPRVHVLLAYKYADDGRVGALRAFGEVEFDREPRRAQPASVRLRYALSVLRANPNRGVATAWLEKHPFFSAAGRLSEARIVFQAIVRSSDAANFLERLLSFAAEATMEIPWALLTMPKLWKMHTAPADRERGFSALQEAGAHGERRFACGAMAAAMLPPPAAAPRPPQRFRVGQAPASSESVEQPEEDANLRQALAESLQVEQPEPDAAAIEKKRAVLQTQIDGANARDSWGPEACFLCGGNAGEPEFYEERPDNQIFAVCSCTFKMCTGCIFRWLCDKNVDTCPGCRETVNVGAARPLTRKRALGE